MLSHPTVISVTHIATGDPGINNILPNSAIVKGTIRSFEPLEGPAGSKAHSIGQLVRSYLDGISSALGVAYKLDLRAGPPPTCNDPKLTELATRALRERWPGAIDVSLGRGMFAEDFAFYTAVVPSLYFALGITKDKLGEAGVHTPEFTIHPESLEHGLWLLVLMAQAAMGYGK
jgi:metal-dependent amidase/aminoacylase/carboxypeptidase family protein